MLTADKELCALLDANCAHLPGLFIVSQVELVEGAELAVKVDLASGVKCERCWKYTQDTGAVAQFPTVCAACGGAVSEMLGA